MLIAADGRLDPETLFATLMFQISLVSPKKSKGSEMVRTCKPAERCIYCDAKEELSTEHIIPFSLGGDVELPLASCGNCRDATSRLELEVARNSLHISRAVSGIQSRRRKKYPKSVRVRIALENGKVIKRDIPLDTAPVIHHVPIFRLPEGKSQFDEKLVSLMSAEPRQRHGNKKLFAGIRKKYPMARDISVDSVVAYTSYVPLIWKIASGFFWDADRAAFLASSCRVRVLMREELYHPHDADFPEGGVLDLFSEDRDPGAPRSSLAHGHVYRSTDNKWIFCRIDMLGELEFPIYTCRIPAIW